MESLVKLPDVTLTKKQAEHLDTVLNACTEYGKEMFMQIIELWAAAGFSILPKPANISLCATNGGRRFTVAGLIPVGGDRQQLIVTGWNSLHRNGLYPAEAIGEFQAAMRTAAELHLTERSAHIWVLPGFDRPAAKAVLQALAKLARSRLTNPEPQPEFVWTTPPLAAVINALRRSSASSLRAGEPLAAPFIATARAGSTCAFGQGMLMKALMASTPISSTSLCSPPPGVSTAHGSRSPGTPVPTTSSTSASVRRLSRPWCHCCRATRGAGR